MLSPKWCCTSISIKRVISICYHYLYLWTLRVHSQQGTRGSSNKSNLPIPWSDDRNNLRQPNALTPRCSSTRKWSWSAPLSSSLERWAVVTWRAVTLFIWKFSAASCLSSFYAVRNEVGRMRGYAFDKFSLTCALKSFSRSSWCWATWDSLSILSWSTSMTEDWETSQGPVINVYPLIICLLIIVNIILSKRRSKV